MRLLTPDYAYLTDLKTDRVFWVWGDQQGRDRTPLNVPDFMDYRERARALEGLAGYFSYGAGLSDEAAGERL
jgi:hypothetical protein